MRGRPEKGSEEERGRQKINETEIEGRRESEGEMRRQGGKEREKARKNRKKNE